MKQHSGVVSVLLTGALAALPLIILSSPSAAQGLRGRRGGVPTSLSPAGSPSSTGTKGTAASSTIRSPLADSSRRLPERSGNINVPRGGSTGNGLSSRNGLGSRPSLFDRAGRPTPAPNVTLPPNGLLPAGAVPLPGTTAVSVVLPPKPNPLQGSMNRPSLPQSLNGSTWNSHWGWGRFAPGTVIRVSDYGVTVFEGYCSAYAPGQAFISPFYVYSCPPFIGARYVVSTPYLYSSGRELGVFSPFVDTDRYGANDGYRVRALRAALNDLTRFWEENDTRALRRHVSPDFAVAVFQEERHQYSLRRGDFLNLSADALDRITTLSLRFDTVRDRTDGLVNAYATHVYRVRGDQTPRVAALRYTLVYVDGDWYVSAVSLASDLAR